MEEKTKVIYTEVSVEIHHKVRIAAAQSDMTISEVVRALLYLWIEGKIQLDELSR